MRTAVLVFDAAGLGRTLYTEAIPLQAIGRLQIRRATRVEFNEEAQLWKVTSCASGEVLFGSTSRDECLAWERANLNPRGSSADRGSL